jgi:hypothetical protein
MAQARLGGVVSTGSRPDAHHGGTVPASGPSPDGSATRQRRRRPLAVTILAVIQVIYALVFGLAAAALASDPTFIDSLTDQQTGGLVASTLRDVEGLALGVLFAGLTILALLAAIQLLRLHRVGWTIAMLLTGLALASQIFTWWTGGQVVAVALLLNVITVFYLNQREVRGAFRIGGGRLGDALEATRG